MILDFVKCRESEASRSLPRRPHALRVFLIQLERPRTKPSAAEEHPFRVSGGVQPTGA
ncbi:MAG TPA: hypothetical protein VEL81_04005 [Thermoplasmata archaeon]|nr:hypothetical protein [Thermoplasmata archaeon]